MKRYALALFAAATFAVGCGSDDATVTPAPVNNVAGVSFRQVEQLARPGINEALLFTNAFLNTYNAVSPAFVATAITNAASPEAAAAAPIVAEVTAVLNAIIAAPVAGGITSATQGITAFLPDVMRCDSTLAIPVGTSAYAFALNGAGSPVAGRKLTDDVIDITYSVLIGTGASDNVPYYAPAGNTNPAIGHQNLNGQAAPFGNATFPFLAPAN